MLNIKYIGIFGIALILIFVCYSVYDYGYTKGYNEYKGICDANLAEISKKAEQQNLVISKAEQKLAEQALQYEQLKLELQNKKEDSKWGDSKKQVFSKEFATQLNYFLQH